MELKLRRIAKRPTYTIGNLYNGDHLLCNTLEDTWRDLNKVKKVKGKTAIPEGRYRIIMAYSQRFGREMPLLCDVPQFVGILIHAGNTDEDTEGCILVGENKVVGKVVNSRYHAQIVSEMINDAIDNGEKVYITII